MSWKFAAEFWEMAARNWHKEAIENYYQVKRFKAALEKIVALKDITGDLGVGIQMREIAEKALESIVGSEGAEE